MDIEQAASPRLPDDIEALRAMVMALMTERDAVTRQLDAVTAERTRCWSGTNGCTTCC
jgi:hypothetical protein